MNASALAPELIVLAARFRTLLRRPRIVQAIAIADGRITSTGTRRGVLGIRRRGTRVIDLGEAVVTPGLVDCHTHFFYWALGRALVIELSAERSLPGTLKKIRQLARSRQVGDWILARGFDYNTWGRGLPTAVDLDAAVPHQPAIVRSRDGHTAWLNTAALQRAGITPGTPDPKGGRYARDAHGRPTGIVQESAVDLLPDPLREFARSTAAAAGRVIDRALDAAYRIAWAHGIVGVHSMDDGPSLFHLQRHHAARRLGVRVVHAVPLADFESAAHLGLCSGFGDNWLRIGGIKIFADGALGSQSAHMFTPYPGRGEYYGVPVVAGAELREVVRKVTRCGWAAWIHAIGDRAVHEAVTALASAPRSACDGMPHRVEHAQCVRASDVRRMAQARICASVQPCHLIGDIAIADRHWPRARRRAFPLRELLDAGVAVAGGSDVPIELLDPRRSLFAATTRTDEAGEPRGGWFPAQRISVAEALQAFTGGAAAAVGAAPATGTLAVGARADLTIWAQDPLRVEPATLRDIGILGCVVDGQVRLGSDT